MTEQSASVGAYSLPLWKKVLFSLLLSSIAFIGLETVIRVGAYFLYNRSPYFLFYGLQDQAADDNPEGHNVAYRGYAKFQPNRLLHQYGMFAKPTPIRINSLGLRGADFAPRKPANVFRIICMGESSTFGFFDSDAFTYPARLEVKFSEGGGEGGRRVEAINAGIPHANSDNILAMLKEELVEYQPDMLTLYAGFNDAASMMDETTTERVLRWMHAHLATYVAMKRLSTAIGGPSLHSRWSGYLSNVPPESVQRQIDLHLRRYERNVREMVAIGRSHKIDLVFIKQPIVMEYDDKSSDWKSLTYAQRVERARARLQQNGFATGTETVLLIHAALMHLLDRIAGDEGIRIVDNIALMDGHPEGFASYVHLTEEANDRLAQAIYQRVKQ